MIDRQAIVEKAAATGWGANRLAREFGISASHTTRILQQARRSGQLPERAPGCNQPIYRPGPGGMPPQQSRQTNPAKLPEPSPDGPVYEEHAKPGGGKTILYRSRTIRTVEDAIREAQVDLTKDRVAGYKIRKWDVTMRGEDGGPPRTAENWYVALDLQPITPDPLAQAVEAYAARLPARRPVVLPPSPPGPRKTLELALYDHHFQMLAWHEENGGYDYDLNIAARLFRQAVSDQIEAAKPYNVGHVLFPIGNDFFHANNPDSVTPRGGNQLDTDGRLAKAFAIGMEVLEDAVHLCLSTFGSVELLWIPGNHDPETGFFLCQIMKAVFRQNPTVTVDVSPTFRKYRTIGGTLLGFTHGVEEKPADLPVIMATECPEGWAESNHREWHMGHFHRRRETKYNAGDTFHGVSVRVLPSLAAADHWHYRHGYTAPSHTSDAFVWCPETGLRAILTTRATKADYSQKGRDQ